MLLLVEGADLWRRVMYCVFLCVVGYLYKLNEGFNNSLIFARFSNNVSVDDLNYIGLTNLNKSITQKPQQMLLTIQTTNDDLKPIRCLALKSI